MVTCVCTDMLGFFSFQLASQHSARNTCVPRDMYISIAYAHLDNFNTLKRFLRLASFKFFSSFLICILFVCHFVNFNVCFFLAMVFCCFQIFLDVALLLNTAIVLCLNAKHAEVWLKCILLLHTWCILERTFVLMVWCVCRTLKVLGRNVCLPWSKLFVRGNMLSLTTPVQTLNLVPGQCFGFSAKNNDWSEMLN